MESGFAQDSQQLWEYMLIAHPNDGLNDKIVNVKKSFLDVYGQKMNAKMKPHITIANFLAKESMEETLIRYIHRVCSQYKSFPVTLNNYSGFPPDTIYVRIQDHAPFKQLANRLKVIDEYILSNGCPTAKLISQPHLVIARGLDDSVFNEAMLDYSQKTFHETFQLTGLVLLKRNNEFMACKLVNVFRFYPPDTNMFTAVA